MRDIWTVSTYREKEALWDINKFLDEETAKKEYEDAKAKGTKIVLMSKVIEGCVKS
ncbi:hypothetical protein H7B90_23610 [Cohnella xylanilytica]|uniref:Uncharacterized protein n=1 Tax=Cohnella xylanilytica TaxID=557555 RepID=A0A841U5N6_9BACL|nr:hypothetical protein [Cohnella xylanilytica]MBB6694388.1 hypothetical protein [Cohnella xylanilytica]